MGAFDGYWGGYGGYAGKTQEHFQYFETQTAFSFYKGFGMPELRALCDKAEQEQSDTVWVPNERPGHGHIGLRTWYVKALIEEYNK